MRRYLYNYFMDISNFRHMSDSRYCFSIDETHTVIRIAISKSVDVKKVSIIYGDPMTFVRQHKEIEMNLKYIDTGFNYFQCTINENPMRLLYIFHVISTEDNVYVYESGIDKEFRYDLAFITAYQYVGENYNDFIVDKAEWSGRVFYQVFPERFNYRKNLLNKEYVNTKWSEDNLVGKYNAFLGGDLYGVIDKIEYLKDLGIGALYLTPIHPSNSNHKYDVLDYFDVDKHFGGKEAFKELVQKSHDNDIKIMLDLVFNHISSSHPIFLDVCQKGKASKYYNWFFINGDKPCKNPLNYKCFGYVPYMPKLNTNIEEVQEYLISIGKYWIEEFDVDGFRLDVSEGVSHDFWTKFKIELKKIKRDILIIGENWLNSESYLGANQFDGVMNYPFLSISSSYVLKERNAIQTAESLTGLLMRYKDGHNKMMLNILSSHDIQRVMNLVHGNINQSLILYAIMMFYVGYPMIYYGEEIFMEGGRDPDNRRGMLWDSPMFQSPYHYIFKQLIKLREIDAIKNGEIEFDTYEDCLIIRRLNSSRRLSLLINLNDSLKINKNPIVANKYHNGILEQDGFIVYEDL